MTPKQTRFVQEYQKDLNATQAAIRCGYSAHTAKQQGSRLLTNADVCAALAAGQQRISAKLEITAEKVLRDLEEARAKAMEGGLFSAAIRATELHGKHIGMFVERTESNVTLHEAIDRPPQETREQWIARRQKELHGPLGTPAGTAD